MNITGVVKDSNKAYKRKVAVNPVAHHYEEKGEKPYIKWGCPVCEAVGNHTQVTEGETSCSLCGVSLNWERRPEKGDSVILLTDWSPFFSKGSRCVIVDVPSENASSASRPIPFVSPPGKSFAKSKAFYTLAHDSLVSDGYRLHVAPDSFVILDESDE